MCCAKTKLSLHKKVCSNFFATEISAYHCQCVYMIKLVFQYHTAVHETYFRIVIPPSQCWCRNFTVLLILSLKIVCTKAFCRNWNLIFSQRTWPIVLDTTEVQNLLNICTLFHLHYIVRFPYTVGIFSCLATLSLKYLCTSTYCILVFNSNVR